MNEYFPVNYIVTTNVQVAISSNRTVRTMLFLSKGQKIQYFGLCHGTASDEIVGIYEINGERHELISNTFYGPTPLVDSIEIVE